jgi:hypothetical protein
LSPNNKSYHGSGWNLPHQKQMMQAYIDGSYGKLEDTGSGRDNWQYWSATAQSEYPTNHAYAITLSTGSVSGYSYGNAERIRCVRSGN